MKGIKYGNNQAGRSNGDKEEISYWDGVDVFTTRQATLIEP